MIWIIVLHLIIGFVMWKVVTHKAYPEEEMHGLPSFWFWMIFWPLLMLFGIIIFLMIQFTWIVSDNQKRFNSWRFYRRKNNE